MVRRGTACERAAFLLFAFCLLLEVGEVFLDLQGERKAVIHVGGFLEPTGSFEPGRGVIVFGTSDPAYTVVGIKRNSGVAFGDGQKLG